MGGHDTPALFGIDWEGGAAGGLIWEGWAVGAERGNFGDLGARNEPESGKRGTLIVFSQPTTHCRYFKS